MTFILAYIDPGSGSLIFQMIIAGFMGLMFVFRRFFTVPIKFLGRLFRRQRKERND